MEEIYLNTVQQFNELYGDEDEEESYLAVDPAYWGVTVNQPLLY